MAHYRQSALAVADGLPAPLALAAVGAPGSASWPELRARFAQDLWFSPDLAAPSLRVALGAGAFRGFGGLFVEPPRLAITHGNLLARSGGDAWLLFADAFGATFHRATPDEMRWRADAGPAAAGAAHRPRDALLARRRARAARGGRRHQLRQLADQRRAHHVAEPRDRAGRAGVGSVKRPLRGLPALAEAWAARWPDALAIWSRFTRLRPPTLCLSETQAKKEGLTGSFAMIRLTDQAVIVSLPQIIDNKITDYPVEILAHEIGHHILAPATLADHARMIARMRWALPTVEQHAPMVANLYTDLVINDRLQRSAELRMADVFRALGGDGDAGAVWAVYMRIYEILWNLPRASLGGGKTDDRMEGDAWLGARLLRSYARDWLDGSGRFAALLLPYLLDDQKSLDKIQALLDTRGAAAGGDPAGLTGIDAGEREGAIHPAQDPELSGLAPSEVAPGGAGAAAGAGAGQSRQPFEYGEILRAAGVEISEHEAAIRYYRERALPHLVAFPSRRMPVGTEPLPEGLEPWDIGHPIDAVDWLQSVLVSPHVVPGMTTVQRVYGTSEGREPARQPLDLDLYVDSSGSMANPQRDVSFPALAGAIICLSALRAGARVQATLWSGKNQFITTDGFVRDEHAILGVLTGYFGGATAFPIHVLRDTFAERKPDARDAHILVVSDDGVSTMFNDDERGQSGWEVTRAALARAGGGGTMVLQLGQGWDAAEPQFEAYQAIQRARDELGFHVYPVATWDDLVAFARDFSRQKYGAAASDGSAHRRH